MDDRAAGRAEERARCALVCDHIAQRMRPDGVGDEAVRVFRAGVELVKQFILDESFTPALLPPLPRDLN